MKRILVPTDFSPVADHAMNYAIEIAAKFESELLLDHVYTFHRKVDFNWDYPEDEQPYVKNIERQMNFTKQKFMDKIKQKGLKIQTSVREANVFALFGSRVKKHNIDLIIMGSKGASGLEKVIFGSVAATALEMANVPVLVVPPNHAFRPLKQLVMATDLDEVSTNILSPLQKLAVKFDAKVTVLNVNTNSNKKENYKNNIRFKDVETIYSEVPLSQSINESINEFVKKNNFDLMCMIRREKGFLESIFKKSITKTQVYNSTIPLLVLPENQINTKGNL
jgi:nucleotide-binding universal stress UspA family protein